MKKVLGIGAVVLLGFLIVGATTAWAFPPQAEATYGAGQTAGGGQGQAGWTGQVPGGELGNQGDLSEDEVEALLMALDDEYEAWSVYDQVMADFGPVWPFTIMRQAEEKHIAALVRLFDRCELDVPATPGQARCPRLSLLPRPARGAPMLRSITQRSTIGCSVRSIIQTSSRSSPV
jgi:hypothetical protein